MRLEDPDNLFGGRLRFRGSAHGWTPEPGVASPEGHESHVDALIDAYFDGDISDNDRIRLFELLRRDPDRCLQFVEMQRTALLLERAPAGPDQTEAILARVDRHLPARRNRGFGRSLNHTRLAIAAAVLLGGAGLVILGQLGSQPPRQPGSQSAPAHTGQRQATAPPLTTSPSAHAPAAAAPKRTALQPGPARTLNLRHDSGQPETPQRSLANVTAGAPDSFPLVIDLPTLTHPSAPSEEMHRVFGLTHEPLRLFWPVHMTHRFAAPQRTAPAPLDDWTPPQPAPATLHHEH